MDEYLRERRRRRYRAKIMRFGVILALVALYTILVIGTSRDARYNDKMCKMYGYQHDCMTKIKYLTFGGLAV